MTADKLINLILNISVWGLFKFFFVVGLFIYLLFALVIIRQVDLMTGVLQGNLNRGIRIVGLIHFGFALIVLLSALILL